MKNQSICLLALPVLLLISNCDNSSESVESQSDFVGTWDQVIWETRSENGVISIDTLESSWKYPTWYIFDEDSTGFYQDWGSSGYITWYLDDGDLVVRYDDGTTRWIYDNYTLTGCVWVDVETADDGSQRIDTYMRRVSRCNIPPRAYFNSNTDAGDIETQFVFDASGTIDVTDELATLTYSWDWSGDGLSDTLAVNLTVLSHRYEDIGTYNVSLEVQDDDGASDSYSRVITVVD